MNRKEIISFVDFVPKTANTFNHKLTIGSVLYLYGQAATILSIRKHTRPKTSIDPEFSYYTVSFDPLNHGWYHVTKEIDPNGAFLSSDSTIWYNLSHNTKKNLFHRYLNEQ